MALETGTRIGMYEILSPLGSGGMGEVYRARDTKLGRDVALKVLPEIFARDHERMARFTREAQLLASLNHPNIAAIHGIEESSIRTALVLEFVDGETLADRIARGPIPLEEALRIGVQIAEALEAAHEKAVIHRDLKPANVKITPDGVVKVLDFGLAKALDDEAVLSANLSQSPTLSALATGAGLILGTAGYMAPEQARGKAVDRRADIWAFGVILFEMLVSRRVFDGETVADTLAKVLERDPDFRKLPPGTPLEVEKLLRRCLVKNVKDRLQAIGDARTRIQELLAEPEALAGRGEAAPYPLWKKLVPWAAVLLLAAALMFKLRPSPIPSEPTISRFEYTLPGGQVLFHGYRHGAELSPDGTRMAFVAAPSSTATRSETRIYIRRLDQWDAVPVPGTEGGLNPFFDPGGQWLGFETSTGNRHFQLKKVALSGGTPVVLVDQDQSFDGASWGPDGVIVFGRGGAGLKVVRDTGGEPEEFTKTNESANEISHRLPHFLPDGSVLFTVVRFGTMDFKSTQVWVKPKNGQARLLLENALDARYAGEDHLIFARQAKLFAVRFDLKTLSVMGPQVLLLEGVTHSLNGTNTRLRSGAAQYSISENGTLLYAPGSIEPPPITDLVWIDRKGTVSAVEGMTPSDRVNARVSADGLRILFSGTGADDAERDLWIFDTKRRATLDRQTRLEGQNLWAVWPPDGARIAFASTRSGPLQIYFKELSSPQVTRLTMGPFDSPSSWTPDGKELAYVHGDVEREDGLNSDIYVVSVDHPDSPRPIVNTRFSENYPDFSPDGKWLAYCSDERGTRQVYVRPYPGPGKAVPISTNGGTEPAWSRDMKELFFINRENATAPTRMMSVRFKISGGEFIPETPVPLFESPLIVGTTPVRSYDVSADGRFLMLQRNDGSSEERNKKIYPSQLRIVVNWRTELERLFKSAK